MRKYISLSVLAFMSAIAFAEPEAKFAKTSHDFGKINENDGKVTTVFEVTNTGDEPLIMNQVRTFLRMHSARIHQEPYRSRAKGNVTVTYNPAGRPGSFKKTITVSSNTKKKTVLSIKGEVIPKK